MTHDFIPCSMCKKRIHKSQAVYMVRMRFALALCPNCVLIQQRSGIIMRKISPLISVIAFGIVILIWGTSSVNLNAFLILLIPGVCFSVILYKISPETKYIKLIDIESVDLSKQATCILDNSAAICRCGLCLNPFCEEHIKYLVGGMTYCERCGVVKDRFLKISNILTLISFGITLTIIYYFNIFDYTILILLLVSFLCCTLPSVLMRRTAPLTRSVLEIIKHAPERYEMFIRGKGLKGKQLKEE